MYLILVTAVSAKNYIDRKQVADRILFKYFLTRQVVGNISGTASLSSRCWAGYVGNTAFSGRNIDLTNQSGEECCVARWAAFGYQSAGFYTHNRPGTNGSEIERKTWPDKLES